MHILFSREDLKAIMDVCGPLVCCDKEFLKRKPALNYIMLDIDNVDVKATACNGYAFTTVRVRCIPGQPLYKGKVLIPVFKLPARVQTFRLDLPDDGDYVGEHLQFVQDCEIPVQSWTMPSTDTFPEDSAFPTIAGQKEKEEYDISVDPQLLISVLKTFHGRSEHVNLRFGSKTDFIIVEPRTATAAQYGAILPVRPLD